MRALVAALTLAVASTGCMKRTGAQADAQAVVVVARRIRTNDPQQPIVQALAMKGGKLLKVGTRAQALEAAGAGALVDELPDAVIVPGLADAHAHLAGLGRSLAVARLNDARSAEEAVAALKAATATASQGDWLLGRGWDQNDWTVKDFPTRAVLDAAFPDRPVYLTRVDGHAAWVNTAALKRAGLGRDSHDPAGGRLMRDARGELTGVLVDNAMTAVAEKISPPSAEQLQRRLKAAVELCAQRGLTSVHDAGMDLQTFALLQSWDALGALPIRVYAMADGQGPEATEYLERGPSSGRLLVMRAVKFLADGALGSRGAALHAPYSDEPSQSGLLLLSPEELESKARAFRHQGFQVAVHAIGDRANTVVIDVLSKLEAEAPGGRHRVEHAQLLTAADVPRFKQAGLIASFQPTHATSDMPWAAARVGEARLQYAYAWRSLLGSGAHVAFGSDFPVEEVSPLLGLYAARTRQDAQAQPPGGWHPEQRVSAEEALAGFTSGAAWAEFAEGRRGMLREGMDADFTALSVDPVDDPPRSLLSAKVLVTVVDGRDVYRAK